MNKIGGVVIKKVKLGFKQQLGRVWDKGFEMGRLIDQTA